MNEVRTITLFFAPEGLEFVKSRLLFFTIWQSRADFRNLPRNQNGNNMEMSDRQMDLLASKVASKLFRMLQGGDAGNKKDKVEIPDPSKMCSVKEAANLLGIGEDQMRRIKDRFPHVKVGEKQQGRILFEREALLKCYIGDK